MSPKEAIDIASAAGFAMGVGWTTMWYGDFCASFRNRLMVSGAVLFLGGFLMMFRVLGERF